MKKNYLLLLFSYILLSCNQSLYDSNTEIIYIDENVKTESVLLNVDIIYTDTILETAKNCFVYSDSILVVQNIKGSKKAFIEFYNLRTQKKITEIIFRGNGPNELLNVIAWNAGNYLLIDGFVNHKFAKINVDNFIKEPSNKICFYPYTFHSQSMELLYDSIFLVENPYCLYLRRPKVAQKVPRLYYSNGDYEYNGNSMISAINVNIGDLLIKPDNTRIIYSSRRNPFIEMYNMDLSLMKVVKGPDSFDLDYRINGDMIQYVNGVPHSYMASCYNDSCIYMAYEGFVKKEYDNQEGNYTNNKTWFFKFDWNVNILKAFYVENIKVLSLSLGLNNTLYVGCKVDGELKLAKCSIQ